jgi:hypothetical protein
MFNNKNLSANKIIHITTILWLLQVGWLGWWFAPEAKDIAVRLANGQIGESIRRHDPFFQWMEVLKTIIPHCATYVLVDCYEAGQDIVARYSLYPRRFERALPTTTPSVLFDLLAREQASFLLVRECNLPSSLNYLENRQNPAIVRLPISGPGLVYRVDYPRLIGGYYD